MVAQNNSVFEEASETFFKLNQNEEVRYLCEMREEGQRILRTYQSLIRQGEEKLAQRDTELAEKDALIAELGCGEVRNALSKIKHDNLPKKSCILLTI